MAEDHADGSAGGRGTHALQQDEQTPPEPAPFASHDDLVEAARRMFEARQASRETTDAGKESGTGLQRLADVAAAWAGFWHESFDLTRDELALCAKCRQADLSRLDREILMVLLLGRLSVLGSGVDKPDAIIRALGARRSEALSIMRALSEHGRLHRASLVSYDEPDDEMCDRSVVVDPLLVELLLSGKARVEGVWRVSTEEELHRHLRALTCAFRRKAKAMDWVESGFPPGARVELYRATRFVRRLLGQLIRTLELHAHWKLARWVPPGSSPRSLRESAVLLILLGKELRHVPAADKLFTGIGLARAVSQRVEHVQQNLELVSSTSALIQHDAIRPCAGDAVLLSDDPTELARTEFELTEKSLEGVGITGRSLKKRSDGGTVREPGIRFSRLVLSEEVREALGLAVAQIRNADVLLDAWGMRQILPYGRGVTMLFYGPPGVGKTASAEALAAEVGRPILIADYSEVQNCFVGMTEKNIVKVFRQAQAHNAVLFWDEADAMFHDRGLGSHTWESRAVNVLLQELERFDGVCILATNRRIVLDPALARRITLKVQFDRPDVEMRREIWKRLMPATLPLADDVDVEELAAADLTGGQIKNVILNAARSALARGQEASICQADLRRAIRLELEGSWGESDTSKIGFAAGSSL